METPKPETPQEPEDKPVPEAKSEQDNANALENSEAEKPKASDADATVRMPPAAEPAQTAQAPAENTPPAEGSMPPSPPPAPSSVPQTQPASRKTGLIIAVVVGVLFLLAAGVFGWMIYQNIATDRAHKVGKCIERDGSEANGVSCDDPQAYKITERINDSTNDKDCPAGTPLAFVNETNKYVLCLEPAS